MKDQQPIMKDQDTYIHTGGGGFVEGDVNVTSGDFVGRDMVNFKIVDISVWKIPRVAIISILGIILSILFGVLANLLTIRIPSIPSGILTISGTILAACLVMSLIFMLARKYYQHRNRKQQESFKQLMSIESDFFKTAEEQVDKLIK